MNFTEGQKIWCRPRIVDNPVEGTFIREITKEENNKGFRNGNIVDIEGEEVWVRGDLCGSTEEEVSKANKPY